MMHFDADPQQAYVHWLCKKTFARKPFLTINTLHACIKEHCPCAVIKMGERTDHGNPGAYQYVSMLLTESVSSVYLYTKYGSPQT
jgi:hypothetical protein